MLRQLAATFRPLLQQHHHFQLQLHSAVAIQTNQCFHSSACAHGLEEFFETPLQEGDKPRTGASCTCRGCRIVINFVASTQLHANNNRSVNRSLNLKLS